MRTRAIEVENLMKSFSQESGLMGRLMRTVLRKEPNSKAAVDSVTFSVNEGETFGLLGRNASGKSTIIRILATLVRRDSGRAEVLGEDVERKAESVKRMIGRVSVDASFWKMLSPMENLHHYALLYGLDAKRTLCRAEGMLENFGVKTADLRKPVRLLSRGTQQKVAIVRALLHQPRLLLLDEPTTGLDPASKLSVHAFLRSLREREGTTILLTTHDMKEAETLCERLVFMTQGKLVAQGSVAELKQQNENLDELFVSLTGENLEEWKDTQSLPEPLAAAGGG